MQTSFTNRSTFIKKCLINNSQITLQQINIYNIPANSIYEYINKNNIKEYFIDWFKEDEIKDYLTISDYCYIFGNNVNEINKESKKIAKIKLTSNDYTRIDDKNIKLFANDKIISIQDLRTVQIFVRKNYYKLINKGITKQETIKEFKQITENYNKHDNDRYNVIYLYLSILSAFDIILINGRFIYKDFSETIQKEILIDC